MTILLNKKEESISIVKPFFLKIFKLQVGQHLYKHLLPTKQQQTELTLLR